jgi:hypothetical protein
MALNSSKLLACASGLTLTAGIGGLLGVDHCESTVRDARAKISMGLVLK